MIAWYWVVIALVVGNGMGFLMCALLSKGG